MRTAFIEQLCTLAEQDDRIWLVCGDLGYSVLEAFSDRFPDRYLNAGVAEQNMTGIAAGLALAGKTVFTYSIANFPVMRCLEQIRNDVCYHNLNVKIVSVGGGLAYGSHGYTHHGVEDLAVMSVMPNMTVVAPGDPVEARAATTELAKAHGPAYLRLGKAGEPVLHPQKIHFEIGRTIQIQDGNQLTLISTGGMLGTAIEACRTLVSDGYSVRLLSMPTLVPLDRKAIHHAVHETRAILTIEEHGIGGLGTRTAEVIAEMGEAIRFHPLRLQPSPIKVAGSQIQLREEQNLSVAGIIRTAKALLR
ncbi:transketolase family protein [Edaphobacter sp. 12200R-103]|jgi:transketolase|uniref:transketolase family protein n=1 Tax=Edaphobacter sp. 12200R-103 TaxID=2703788 RepID=UPI00138CA77F|nr:transketolase C-terminal domain-containing protein [Edaphobacter sp. 12200R-103]QHS52977.1 transketolase [Edaphobacter sp. 12200R-103]